MKAYINQDDPLIYHLPVEIGTPVFIINHNQHDGYYKSLIEYSPTYFEREIFTNIKHVEEEVKQLNWKIRFNQIKKKLI